MDKVTQAMLASKAESLASNLEGASGQYLTTKEEKSNLKKKEKSVNEMEAKRIQQQKDIALAHQKRNIEREEMRNNIRNKYRLKGSPEYSGSYYMNRKKDTGQSNIGEDELQSGEESKKCSVQ